MVKVHAFPQGQRGMNGRMLSEPVDVYHYSKQQRQTCKRGVTNPEQYMHLRAKVQGADCVMAVDTQATHCFISEDFVEKVGIPTRKAHIKVELANDSATTVTKVCDVHFHLKTIGGATLSGYSTALVMPLSPEAPHQLLLGQDWQRRYEAVLNCATGGIEVKHPHTRVRMKLRCMAAPPTPKSVMSQKAFARACRQTGTRVFQVNVTMAEPDGGSWSDELAFPEDVSPETRALLQKYKHVFQKPTALPPDRSIGHIIPEVEGSKPVYKHPYRLSPLETAEMHKQIAELLAKGFIEPSTSPYGAPILFATKADGTLRMCIDYRKLNDQTIKTRYPLPRIEDLLDKLQGARYFTTLDLHSGYHQILIEKGDRPKTAFTTPCGHYQWNVMPFGLCSAPSTFQRMMNTIFGPLLKKGVTIYLDDVCIGASTKEEHDSLLKQVLQLLDKHKLRANLKKCQFEAKSLKYLGHIVSHDGIRMDPAKTQCVMDWPPPSSLKDTRSFLGLANYFRRFIMGYATLAQPLQNLLKADKWSQDMWTPECQTAFQNIKKALTSAPTLAIYDAHSASSGNLEIWADASHFAIGAVLMQSGQPIAYMSKTLKGAELNWTVTDQELFAIIEALQVWRCYVEGIPFTVCTDHNPLVHLQSQPSLSRRQVRWSEKLQQYQITYKYIPGRINVADPLSRIPQKVRLCAARIAAITRSRAHSNGMHAPHLHGRMADTQPSPNQRGLPSTDASHTQKRDRATAPPDSGQTPQPLPAPPVIGGGEMDRAEVQNFVKEAYSRDAYFAVPRNTQHLHEREGLWYTGKNQLVLPDAPGLRQLVLKYSHDAPHSGHFGERRTYEALAAEYWWPGLRKDVKRYVETCRQCQRSKALSQKPSGLLMPLEIPEGPWQSVAMDFITDLPETQAVDTLGRPFDRIVTFVDRFSKMVLLRPCSKHLTAEQMAQLFYETVFVSFGMPKTLVSDRDTLFTSAFFKHLTSICGVKHGLTTSYHPQADGQVERVHRTLGDMLRNYIGSLALNEWHTLLPAAQFAINNSWHVSLGSSPFKLILGYRPRLPFHISDVVNPYPPAREWAQLREHGLSEARKCLEAAQSRQKAYYDGRHKPASYKVGDLVMLKTDHLTVKRDGQQLKVNSSKLMPKWMGPFEVTHIINALAYKLKLPTQYSRVHPVFHVSKLKPYKHDPTRGPDFDAPPREVMVGDYVEYLVDRILEHKVEKPPPGSRKHPQYKYLVQFKDFPHPTWEPAKNINDCVQYFDYWQSLGQPAPRPRGRPPKHGRWDPTSRDDDSDNEHTV